MRVLVVDDSGTNRRIISEYVKTWGCVPSVAASGVEALEMLRAAARRAPYRLVLVDAQMPGMDGFDLTRIITTDPELKDTVVLMLSSMGPGVADKGRAAGAARYVSKPVMRSALFNAMIEALAPAASDAEVHPATDEAPAGGPGRLQVLVAEDNPINSQVATRMLTREGHSVDVVETGSQAIDALRAGDYDVVLMDVQMPEMDGLEATRLIRRDPDIADIPIIALTAHAMEGDREQCLQAGMDDYLPKPFDHKQLITTVNRWGSRSRARTAGADTASEDEPPEDTSPPDVGAADASPLKLETLLEAVDGDEEFAWSLITEFLEYAGEQLAQLARAPSAGDAELIRDIAHSIKGAAANLAAEPVRAAAARLEELAREGEVEAMPPVVAQLEEAFAELRAWAEQQLRVKPSTVSAHPIS
ncbi:MAG: response regulator, partial [Armatimonadetes bacterium]|nr:response regulator [Armatimonadota bacterium]